MELNYFKDLLFDLINESDEMNVADIISDDSANTFLIAMPGGSTFEIEVKELAPDNTI